MNEGPAGRDSCGTLFLCVPVMGGMGVIGQMGEMGQIGKSYLYGPFHSRKEVLWMFVCCDSALLVGYFASRINGLSLS